MYSPLPCLTIESTYELGGVQSFARYKLLFSGEGQKKLRYDKVDKQSQQRKIQTKVVYGYGK